MTADPSVGGSCSPSVVPHGQSGRQKRGAEPATVIPARWRCGTFRQRRVLAPGAKATGNAPAARWQGFRRAPFTVDLPWRPRLAGREPAERKEPDEH